MAEIVHHVIKREDRRHLHHRYLVDVGSEIEIQQVLEYKWKVFDSVILAPPHPKTRFFEITLDEHKNNGGSSVEDMDVCPVTAEKKPDWKFLGIVLKKGPWEVTGRIFQKANNTETVWIYSDDFHIFAITHAQDAPDALVSQVIEKIDNIAVSIKGGFRVHSHMEAQKKRREAFDATMDGESGITLSKAAITNHPEYQLIAQLSGMDAAQMQESILQDLVALGATLDISSAAGVDQRPPEIPKDRDITPQMTQIEELQDLSWLYE